MSNGAFRWSRLSLFAASALLPLSVLAACSSDDADANGNGLTPPTEYVPVEASAQNPLPPGAGPRPDSGVVTPPPPPPDAAGDTSTPMDVNVPESSPADTGAGDATVG